MTYRKKPVDKQSTKRSGAADPAEAGEHIPDAPAPVGSATEGIADGQELAAMYMTNCVRLWAAVAFGNGPVELWTRLQASRMLALTAGAFPEPVPSAPNVSYDGAGQMDA